MSESRRRVELAVAALVGGAVGGALVWYLTKPPQAAAEVLSEDQMAAYEQLQDKEGVGRRGDR